MVLAFLHGAPRPGQERSEFRLARHLSTDFRKQNSVLAQQTRREGDDILSWLRMEERLETAVDYFYITDIKN